MQALDNNTADTNKNRWLITITVMLVAVLEVLDATIINVSLPHMMGSLGASSDEITWVLTTYIVTAAVFMPLTGFLVKRMGQKRLLLFNIIGFLSSSMLCGIASSLPEIVLFRALQGACGASLLPLSQIILRATFPPEEISKAMTIWGIGIMAGPVMGPTLGGYITETLNWRWAFYINVPICLVAALMAIRVIKDTPIVKEPIDWFGMALMAIGIGSLQLVLDRGNVDGWFDSQLISLGTVICIITLVGFIVQSFRYPTPIIQLRLFTNRNFTCATLCLGIFCACILGSISLQPIMMERLFNYPSDVTGLIMAPRGIASAFGMMFASVLLKRQLAPRIPLAIGMSLALLGSYQFTLLDLSTSPEHMTWISLKQGFGMGLFFVPLSTLSLSTLPAQSIAEAAGLYSFGRSLGNSIGISVLSTVISRSTQTHWNELGGRINPFNPQLHYWLNLQGLSLSDPNALSRLAKTLSNQASMLGFLDAFSVATLGLALLLPLSFLFRKKAA